MSGIPAKNSKFKRVVDEFINWLSEFFKINLNDTAYGEAYTQLQDIIMNY
jgi:hypothetical protein